MIVSIAIAVLPVWRSPMISSRWPRPIGIIASIAFSPVCIGSFTGWRWTTPGALNSAGRVSVVLISPLSSSGRPSGSTRRPSSSSPTGISSSWPVRLTVSPSTILSHSPKSTAPTLSSSRLSASPVTSCGSSSISSDMQLSSPWTRAMPSPTEHGADLGEVGGLRVQALDPLAQDAGDLVWLDFHLRALRSFPYAACGDALSQFLEPVADARVEDHVADLQRRARRGCRRRRRLCSSTVSPVCSLDLRADPLDDLRVELDRAGHGHARAACSPSPRARRTARRIRKITGIRCFSISSSRKLTSSGSASAIACFEALALLGRGEVGAEEEELQVAVVRERVGELAELLADRVELPLLLAPPRTGPRHIRGRSPPSS